MTGDMSRVCWGIQMRSRLNTEWGRPIGCAWIAVGKLQPGVIPWPAGYRTRVEAREKAKALTAEHAYLWLGWRFRAVRMSMITRMTR